MAAVEAEEAIKIEEDLKVGDTEAGEIEAEDTEEEEEIEVEGTEEEEIEAAEVRLEAAVVEGRLRCSRE